jgi:hypothetical protein
MTFSESTMTNNPTAEEFHKKFYNYPFWLEKSKGDGASKVT